ncbi:MAG: hypothetical protein GY803_27950, partial [Chloroflexi bacterium]|nr:hypothetical protein [Chloroflexota bacterium]
LIATSQVGLEAEFNDANYTLPLDTYNPALTTFVGTIGNTLGNNDMVFLVSSSTEVTDCVSWGTGPSCNLTPGGASPFAGTAYASGSNGADGAPGGSATGQGQSIVNVGSTWGVSVLDDPSPYGINTIDGGPTAVKLNEITVSDSSPLVIVSLAGVFLMIISGWLVARRKATA